MLKLVFEWCRIHIKTVLAQQYSLVVFYPILLWFTYAWFIQATPVQLDPGPPKSAQVNPNLQVLPGSPRFSQVLPGSPRFSQEISDFLRFYGFPGFPGRTWVLFSAILWGFRKLGVIFCVFVGFRDFLGEPGCYFLRFCGVSGISWENLGGSWGWPGRAARVSSGKSGWRVARYFDLQFLNFCRRRCRPLWPAGLPRFKI